ncbi:MAG: hypothetical protein K2R98_14330 [Gemmataceae bacterium]|nr:hypothetical protein [Gemmataceae bacterium]
MKLTHDELEFLSAWAREEWEPACYQLPFHRLQLCDGVSAAELVVFIKAWTKGVGTKNQDILDTAANSVPRWPWSTSKDYDARFIEAIRSQADSDLKRCLPPVIQGAWGKAAGA